MISLAGVVPFTTIDYPGALACVAFTQGCPWRCFYCHNPELQRFCSPPTNAAPFQFKTLLDFLKKRQGLLDAVVLSGGEPTAQENVKLAIQSIKKLNFKVGIHTAGIYPGRLESILEDVDWIGFDIKTLLNDSYDKLTGRRNSYVPVVKSLEILSKTKVPIQFRLTFDKGFHTPEQIPQVSAYLANLGFCSPLAIQERRFESDELLTT